MTKLWEGKTETAYIARGHNESKHAIYYIPINKRKRKIPVLTLIGENYGEMAEGTSVPKTV